MWTRQLLKYNARAVLSRVYWRCLLACIIVAVLANANSGISFSTTVDFNPSAPLSYNLQKLFYSLPTLISFAAFGFTCSIIWGAFIRNPIQVGFSRYLMENREGTSPFGTLFSVFQNSYLNTVKVMFFYDLEIFLWSLLLVIPGIIKSYQYRMVPYLLAENPNMSWERAKELSTQMTAGEKWNIFVLDLSFIGWLILGNLIIIGSVFVGPYIQATNGELYAALRAKAAAQNLTFPNELNGFVRYEE